MEAVASGEKGILAEPSTLESTRSLAICLRKECRGAQPADELGMSELDIRCCLLLGNAWCATHPRGDSR